MKKITLAILFLLGTSLVFSQIVDTKLLNDLKARSIGPGGMSGRVTAIAVEPGNDAVFYVGTASGGIWKTTNGGTNFTPIFDKEAVAGIGALCIDPNNPDVVWVGTGEGNPRNSITGGYGLYRSLDAGRTWQLMGLEKTRHIHRIIVHPKNSNIIYVGAIGSPWGPHKERGVFKSTDGGKNWKNILFTNEQSGVAEMVMDPRNPEKLYVSMWEHLRHPWFFKSGGEGSGLFITVDGGDKWKKLAAKDGLPNDELGRIGLAVSKSNPEYVYALVESKKNALYRSTDGGYTWTMQGTDNIGDRPFYYAEIYVDPSNENRVYTLYSNVNVSEDGGKTFSTLVGRSIHSDHHAWWIHPENPDFMIDGNDGGLAITYDKGKNWRHITNLPVSQFYHISIDDELPYNVYGGMQDNGSWKGPAYTWTNGGIINEYWNFLLGGDGFDVVPVPGDSRYCYAMSQQGNLCRVDTESGDVLDIKPAEGDVKLRWHWNSALAQDPFQQNTIYYGSQFVHKSTDRGDSWEIISPDLTTNDTSRQKFNESGGLTYDVTGAETYTCILAISPSPLEKDIIWIGTDDGNIQLTKDGGKNWSNLSPRIKGLPVRAWIPQIVPSEYKKEEAFIVVNNYRQNDYQPYLYHTTDFGKTWERLVEEGDVPGYVLSFVQDPVQPNLMFLGTEFGLYVSINKGEDWVKWGEDFPTVSTMDMKIQKREGDLVIGTFGRSAYVIDDIVPLRKWAEQGDSFKDNIVQAFPSPDAYVNRRKNAPGYYFHGDAYFRGENRPSGARITYYVKKGKSSFVSSDEKTSVDTTLIKIMDLDDNVLRTMQHVPDSGINRTSWYFDKDGINLEFGGRRKQKYPGGGGFVLAGDYKIRVIYQEDSSETQIKVLPDPRIPYDREASQQTQDYISEVLINLVDFNTYVKQLNKCKSSLKIIEQIGKGQASDTLKASIKSISKEIERLNKELNGESDVKGYYMNEDLFVYRIRPLTSILYSYDPLTPNDLEKLKRGESALEGMKKEIVVFLEKDWKDFEDLVKSQGLSFLPE